MKKVLLCTILAASLVLLMSCEPAVKNVIISQYPHKLIYVVGYDTELDLSGGELTFFMSDGSVRVNSMEISSSHHVSHNIDFDKPGVYIVGVISNSYTFAVQVVDIDYIDNITNTSR